MIDITLQDFVGGALLVALIFGVMRLFFALIGRNAVAHEIRETTRCCAQCGLRERVSVAEGKYGVCANCEGVTTKGRSRKLG
jgi:hypothetical protein